MSWDDQIVRVVDRQDSVLKGLGLIKAPIVKILMFRISFDAIKNIYRKLKGPRP